MKADTDELATAVRLAAPETNGTLYYAWTFLRRLNEEFPAELEMEIGQEAAITSLDVHITNEYRFKHVPSQTVVRFAVETKKPEAAHGAALSPTCGPNTWRSLISSRTVDFFAWVSELASLSEREVMAAGARIPPLELAASLHVAGNAWAAVQNWNNGLHFINEAPAEAPSSLLQRLQASLMADAERLGRRVEDVIAGIRAELEKTLQPLPTPQLAMEATHVRGASKVRGPLIKGAVDAGAGPKGGQLDIQLTRGPELRAGRLRLAATVDSALPSSVVRVVLAAGDYEVTLVDAPIEADMCGGLIRVDCPLGDLARNLADGKLPAGAFRFIVMTPEQANASTR